ncbi:hypothetical protein J7I08_004187 [Vibrio vulnificus]|nr:hypothetical protein [Vibrio vulnificus]
MGKNDLQAIKKPEKTILPNNKPGRKKKDPNEKESELIPLKLTPVEFEILKKKAGLANITTYLKHLIRTETDWLEDK